MVAPRVILSEAVMRCNRSVTGLPRIFDSSVEGDSVEDGSCWNATLCLALDQRARFDMGDKSL